jgi:hypothetical protein
MLYYMKKGGYLSSFIVDKMEKNTKKISSCNIRSRLVKYNLKLSERRCQDEGTGRYRKAN